MKPGKSPEKWDELGENRNKNTKIWTDKPMVIETQF